MEIFSFLRLSGFVRLGKIRTKREEGKRGLEIVP